MELSWSRWFRCESSFELLLVPDQPGIFALAEEVARPAGPNSRRMLAVIEISEAESVARTLSRLFAPGSPWRERLKTSSCYLRYAVVADARERRAAAEALKNWLNSQLNSAARIFEKAGEMQSERRIAAIPQSGNEGAAAQRGGALGTDWSSRPKALIEEEAATVAERAVDRVMATRPQFPAGF